MIKGQHSSAYAPPELSHEFDADTTVLLRRRFLWFLGCWGGVLLVVFLLRWGGHVVEKDLLGRDVPVLGLGEDAAGWTRTQRMAEVLGGAAQLALYAATFFVVRQTHIPRRRLARLTTIVIVTDGCILIAESLAGVTSGLSAATLTHVIAAMFLPWTPWQAARPILILAGVHVITNLLFRDAWRSGSTILALAASVPASAAPGTLTAWLKHSRRVERYKLKILAKRYGEFRRELHDARKIHEAMFPKNRAAGPVRFFYEYEPMLGMGGDFVFVSCPAKHQGECLSVVLLDVTGHGLAAALTVNRLYGELERLYAENPDRCPGEVLGLLNRYVHLTLSPHSIFATAFCLRVDCREDRLEYANGGHPTAFLRAADGKVHDLGSTSFVLGALPDTEFEPSPRRLRFADGDSLLIYTDGAIEAKDERGRMLGIDGMRGLVASSSTHVAMLTQRSLAAKPMNQAAGAWARTILRAVESHRSGPPKDDTLVVEVSRPIGRGRTGVWTVAENGVGGVAGGETAGASAPIPG
ncbi:MAG: serine/threonine-protein phosphatase [Phycisphaeraceae bacterium]|nr:MAG: serine/threonine-protein phosphatase [Phycisphaeraceae bacterium]